MITTQTELDVSPGGIAPVIHVSQYDTGSRTLVFNLTASAGDLVMPGGVKAEIRGTKPDGNGFSYECGITGKVVTADVTQQMTAAAGKAVCELVLYTGEPEREGAAASADYTQLATGIFTYSASYTLGDETTDLGTFTVTGNSEAGYVLEGIPVGAVLDITESEDNSYDVSTALESGAADTNSAANIVSFTVPNGGETVTYTNNLKSYPVKIVKVDQDGNAGVEARFSLSQDGSGIVNGKYTTPSDNVIYSGNLYVGTYTLTEDWVEDNYLGLSTPVTLSLSGDDTLISDNSGVTVTGNKVIGFTVTVVNRATKAVTVKKELDDPLISQRTFNFTASYQLNGVTESLPNFTITSSTGNPGLYVLTVPVGADLTVAEDTTGLTDIYKTEAGVGGGQTAESSSITLDNIRDEAAITFTNKRKTAEITVVKEMSDTTVSEEFDFTATLKNGSNPLPAGYLVFTTADEAGSGGSNEPAEYRTDENGNVYFKLSHGMSQKLTVPVGTSLIIREETDEYTATTTSRAGTADGDTADNSFTMTVTDSDTITFLNQPKGVEVILKKVGYDNRTEESKDLAGATFKIYNDPDKTPGSIVTLDGKTEFTSGEDGLLYEGELAAGTYYFDEVHVPAGYYMPTGMFVLTVENNSITLNSTETIGSPSLDSWISEATDSATGKTVYTVSIQNVAGVELPSTGGPGTEYFYLFGILLTAFAGFGFVMKRRREAD